MVRALKVIGLGTLIWFGTFLTIIIATIAIGILKAMRSAAAGVVEQGTHATGLSAVVFNPVPWLIILVAYGVAYWMVRK